ncbi:LysR family transcriptional regulator [Vibrio kasasachensis]|uniref:LysR family transcriptional regulator n=1 Tax=Vibrio kasasachensis TaxID=2910248 RepID=UPI003D12F459
MDKLTAMKLFVRIAQVRSFSKVANEMDVSPSYVSKHVAYLESQVDTRLLQRTTRSISLTLAGERYLARCLTILSQVELAEGELMEQTGIPSGKLRLSVPSVLGESATADMCAQFLSQYPNIDLDVMVEDRFIDLIEEGFDLCIRASSSQPDSNLIYRYIGKMPFDLVGSKTYLERHGYPKSVQDLKNLKIIVHRYANNTTFSFSKQGQIEKVNIHQRVRVNSAQLVHCLVARHQGLAFLPRYIFKHNPEIEVLLSDYDNGALTISLVYPEREHAPQKVRQFITFFKAWFEEQLAS